MQGENILISLEGGAPWGFRLFGGEEEPLVIAKLRKRSKAAEAGLKEEDLLLEINGCMCEGMSHSRAMELIDSAGNVLHLGLLRMPGADSVSQVEQNNENRSVLQIDNTQDRPTPGFRPYEVQIATDLSGPGVEISNMNSINSNPAVPMPTSPSFQTEINAPMPTSPNFQTGINAPMPTSTNFQTERNVPIPTSPNFQNERNVPIPTSPNIQSDESQNQVPSASTSSVSVFKVSNAVPVQQPGVWKPPVTSPPVQFQPNQVTQEHTFNQQVGYDPSGTTDFQETPPFTKQEEDKMPIKWVPPKHVTETDTDPGSMSDSSVGGRPGNIEIKPVALKKLIKEGSGSDEPTTPDSPTSWKKKRFYADSSFYNDPSGKYPTLEEQVKMARKVALSLTAPVNLDARGHKMFIKRKEKSTKWSKEKNQNQNNAEEESEDDSTAEPYYNPDPWSQQGGPKKPSPSDGWDPAGSTAPEDDIKLWKAPVIPSQESKKNALSADEFERMRLYEEKNLHENVSPQACFDLAQALKSAHGKSGKMFNKRKQRMEKYTTDESNVKHTPPTPIASQEKHYAELGPPTNRLKEMIEMPKPKMSPWEAALEDGQGNVDAAFEHLRRYEANKISSVTPKGDKNKTAETPISMGKAVPPQGDNRAARPWQGMSKDGSSGAGGSKPPSVHPKGKPAIPTPAEKPPGFQLPPIPAENRVPNEQTEPSQTESGQTFTTKFGPATHPKPVKQFAPVRFNPQAKTNNGYNSYPGGFLNRQVSSPQEAQPTM